jgi:hypothetical protein
MKLMIFTSFLFCLIGCSDKSSSNDPALSPEESEGNIIIYISKGNTQCNNDGLSLEESIQQLRYVGIDVLDTYCGATTGLIFPAVCGGGTADIIAHEIRAFNLSDANDIGYENVETVVDIENMLSYEISECEDI